jgi:ABC-2 type transport system permease protein
VEAFFNTIFFWFPFVLIFPLITMRLFSEEYKLGTIESLLTAPVTDLQVVLAKYFGAVFFYIVLWAPSLLYFVIFQDLTKVSAAGAAGSYVGAYVMLLLIGMFYLSIGCFASSLTSNQIVAAVISFALILLMFFCSLISFLVTTVSPALRDLVYYLSAIEHIMDFSRGIFDTRPVVFYCTMTFLMLFLTHQVFQYRRWKA